MATSMDLKFTEVQGSLKTTCSIPMDQHMVMRMMRLSGLFGLGYHLTTDNYFSSPVLFLDLYQLGTVATGTVRSNRKGLPRDTLRQRLRNHERKEKRKGPLFCVAYQDGSRKPVLLSTKTTVGTEQVNVLQISNSNSPTHYFYRLQLHVARLYKNPRW